MLFLLLYFWKEDKAGNKSENVSIVSSALSSSTPALGIVSNSHVEYSYTLDPFALAVVTIE